MEVHLCQTEADFNIAKSIAKNYMQWLGMDLNFQNTDKEFNQFDTMYGAPEGAFIYVTIDGKIAGGVATRKIDDKVCEMKRLYVYSEFQGKGLGKLLCQKIIDISKELGYQKMRLDTVSRLESANALYQKLGFKDIPAYYPNPDPTVRYMEYSF